MSERAKMGFAEAMDDDLPELSIKPRPRPNKKAVDEASEKSGFNRRIKTPPEPPVTKRASMKKKEPRPHQIGVRVTQRSEDLWYKIFAASPYEHVASLFEEAIDMLAERYGIED